jgi:hypothetical protein
MGLWWCHTCDREVEPQHVTHEEEHDERAGGCGDRLEWVDDEETPKEPPEAYGVEGAAPDA